MKNKLLMPTLCESVMKLRSAKQATTPKQITEYIWATTSDVSIRPDLSTVRKALKLAVKQGILQRSRDGTYRINLKAAVPDKLRPTRRHRKHRSQDLESVEMRHRGHSRSRRRRGRSSRRHRRSSRRHRRRSHSRHGKSHSYSAATSPYRRSRHHRRSHYYD